MFIFLSKVLIALVSSGGLYAVNVDFLAVSNAEYPIWQTGKQKSETVTGTTVAYLISKAPL